MIKHRTFVKGVFPIWLMVGMERYCEQVRAEAEEFVNCEVGPDNVISVSESGTRFGTSSITVWYRDKASR